MTDDLDANDARAGYHRKLGYKKRPALLLVDFVQAYFDPASPLYAGMRTRSGPRCGCGTRPRGRACPWC